MVAKNTSAKCDKEFVFVMNVTAGDSRVLAEFLPTTAIIKTRKLEQFVSEIRVTGFEWLKDISKKNTQHFDLCKNNLKASWKLIGMPVKRNCAKGQTPISKLIRNNSNKDEIVIRMRLLIN